MLLLDGCMSKGILLPVANQWLLLRNLAPSPVEQDERSWWPPSRLRQTSCGRVKPNSLKVATIVCALGKEVLAGPALGRSD